ncbi:MAG: NlpC/P60 family protein [Candidatus Paceibacterota bacterium]|jgi:hypothetical protein
MEFEYKATESRCAVMFDSFNLPISHKEALEILNRKGFEKIEVDILELAKQCVGKSQYRRGVRIFEAPAVLDCSSFMKYLYAQRGIWLPRRSIQQRELGEIVDIKEIMAGDLVFISGYIDYYISNPVDGVGHVGIATENKTVIHAANKENGVIETSLSKFINEINFRGIRRYVPKSVEVLTFKIPINIDIETSDDLKWIILQNLTNY